MKRLEGKVAVITGGGTGIGKAISLAMAAEGASVALWDVQKHEVRRSVEEIVSAGHSAKAMLVDVSRSDQVNSAADQVLKEWRKIDILVNNAGICQVAPVEAITDEDWDRVLAVNLKGTFLCSRAVMGSMKARRSGRIINMASIAGKLGGISVAANYSASKAGVICLTKTLARELAPFNVLVNAISPGVVESNMTRAITGGDWSTYLSTIPLGRIGTLEEVAAVAVFLASEDSRYITGEILDVNGGQLMD